MKNPKTVLDSLLYSVGNFILSSGRINHNVSNAFLGSLSPRISFHLECLFSLCSFGLHKMTKEATVPFLAVRLEGGLRSLDTLKASCKVNGLASRRAGFSLSETFLESYDDLL